MCVEVLEEERKACEQEGLRGECVDFLKISVELQETQRIMGSYPAVSRTRSNLSHLLRFDISTVKTCWLEMGTSVLASALPLQLLELTVRMCAKASGDWLISYYIWYVLSPYDICIKPPDI